MPKYFVALNRPEVDAADPEEAMAKCLSEPVGPNDTFYVKEVAAGGVYVLCRRVEWRHLGEVF